MGDRKDILERAIFLFSTSGYENVTMKDIAEAANTAPAEIYNYFVSKDAMLEVIYALYSENVLAERPTPEVYIPILESGTAEEILNIFNFPLPEPISLNFCIVRIVMTRRSSDERARAINLQVWEKSLAFINEVMVKGIEIGRLAMTREEIDSFAHLVYSSREYSANMATLIPEQIIWREIETYMIQQLSTLIVLKDSASPTAGPGERLSTILAEAIQNDSVAIGKYYHYSATLKRIGQAPLSNFIDEIIENTLDELDTLYVRANRDKVKINQAEIIRQIADNEKKKRLEAEKADDLLGDDVFLFSDIAELAQQHERICLRKLR